MKITGARKAVSGLVLLTVGIVITQTKGDIPPNLLSLLQSLYFAFVAGNGVEHVSNATTQFFKNKKEESENQ